MALKLGRQTRAVRHPQQKPRHGTRLDPRAVSRFGGLLGFWAMTEGSGATLKDLSPNGRDATFTPANLSWRGGKTGATLFSNSAVTTQAGATVVNNFTYPGKLTVEALVAPDLITGVYRCISRSDNGGGNGPGLYLGSNNKFTFYDGSNNALDGTTTPVAGQYYHVVGTYDGVTKKLYVNGKLESSVGVTWSGGTGTLQSFSDNFNGNFNGRIEFVRWWDRALTQDQISTLTESPHVVFEPDPVPALLFADVPPLPPMALPGTTPSGTTTRKRYFQKYLPTGGALPAMRLPGTTLSGVGGVRRRFFYRSTPLTPSVNPQSCWEPLTQKLLGYLGKPFLKGTSGLLWSAMSTVARELTACVSTVVMNAGEARGGGTFTFPVTFDPIGVVAGVRRVSALGVTQESYTVVSWDTRSVTVTGIQPPRAGDYLQVDYTYLHTGLLGRINSALMELDVLTSTGSFLDAWGSWFGMTRVKTGKYGQAPYGFGQKYGTGGVEPDNTFANRIIDRVTQGRNTPVAIVAAVRRLTGGSPYLTSWIDAGGNNSFIFRPAGALAWAGEADTRKHLIWGRTARFLKSGSANGGAFVFEVWVPSGSGYSKSTLLSVVNQYKPAGSKAYIRYYS